MNEMDFSEIEFAENADPRCPVVLVLDCSSSMMQLRPGEERSPMDALNDGLDVLVTELHKDTLARRRVEVSFVTYGSSVTPATEFTTVDNLVVPSLVPSGMTSTGAAINEALDAIENRKKTYRENGVQYYRPWVMLITDGLATDDVNVASQRIKENESRKKVSFFAVGVEGYDHASLSKIGVREPLGLRGVAFDELFVWLSASQASVSSSTPGDAVPLPSPAGWAEV